MARKKPHEEHENHERWMVSYADFLTLLFATFVVLYALSQISLAEFKDLDKSMKEAFTPKTIFQGKEGVLSDGKEVMESKDMNAMFDSLMLEYVSPAYEQDSYEKIKKEIEAMTKKGELDGISATIDDRGLVIKINDKNVLFKSGSAEPSDEAKKVLDIVGKLIVEKFAMHNIRIEGHTDPMPMKSAQYPSNWELSSARASSIVRYFIGRFKLLPDLFSAVGYADTRPDVSGKSAEANQKNRRVEIIVVRNQNKKMEHGMDSFIKLSEKEQKQLRKEQIDVLSDINNKEIQQIEQKLKEKKLTPTPETVDSFQEETRRLDNLKQ